MFAGYNPGGREGGAAPSAEEGNAYRVETWPDNGRKHQRRVVRLVGEIGNAVAPGKGSDDFIDGLLTTNFWPFRSPSQDDLHRPAESIAFSEALWRDIFGSVLPRVILANGVRAATLYLLTLRSAGFQVVDDERFSIGWGRYTYQDITLRRSDQMVRLFGLPHLSRFDIRGDTERAGLVARVAGSIGSL
jgi:hypothetical protein